MLNKIEQDLKDSLKNHDKFKLSVLRMLKSALQSEKINKKCELTDEDIIVVIKRQIKQRVSSKEEYLTYNREDLANSLEQEIEILKAYLPEELSEDDIDRIIDEIFEIEKFESVKDMGKAMKIATEKFAMRADMGLVSKKIKNKLSK